MIAGRGGLADVECDLIRIRTAEGAARRRRVGSNKPPLETHRPTATSNSVLQRRENSTRCRETKTAEDLFRLLAYPTYARRVRATRPHSTRKCTGNTSRERGGIGPNAGPHSAAPRHPRPTPRDGRTP